MSNFIGMLKQTAQPVDRIPQTRVAQRADLVPKYFKCATTALRSAAPWAYPVVVGGIWFTYAAWRESFKDRVIPGYAAYHGHTIEEPKKK